MAESRPSLEVIAPTVEEAIARGAEELGIPRQALEVEVLDEGSRGLLGMGARQARVRLTVPAGAGRQAPQTAVAEAEPEAPEAPEAVEAEDQETLRIARETVEELVNRMGVSADVSAHWGERDSPGKVRPLHVDVRGKDLSLLIGRRGDTLEALQYITRLIVGKELHKPVSVIVDVEGYRKRREQTLRRLARRMADQAVERDRTLSLEPMPPNERRIIHIELRDHPRVRTESVGEGGKRKVTIIPQT